MAKVYPTVVGKYGYTYYQIPKNEIFYRGDTGIYLSSGQLPPSPAFFSNLKKRVKNYGLVFTFQTKKVLNLLALDLPQQNQKFYENADGKIKRILEQQYGFLSGIRDTVHEKDYELLNYLCNDLKIDGYYCNEMDVRKDVPIEFEDDGKKDTDPSKFHSEMGLCNVPENIKFVDYQKDIDLYSKSQIESAVEDKRLKDHKYELARQRKRKSRPRFDYTSSESEIEDPFGHFLSGVDSDDEGSTHSSTKSSEKSINQSLFGSPGRSPSTSSQDSPGSIRGSPPRNPALGPPRTNLVFGSMFDSPINEGNEEDDLQRIGSIAELRDLDDKPFSSKRATPIRFDFKADFGEESIQSPAKKMKKTIEPKTPGATGGLRRKKTNKRKRSNFSKKKKKRKSKIKKKRTIRKKKQSKKKA